MQVICKQACNFQIHSKLMVGRHGLFATNAMAGSQITTKCLIIQIRPEVIVELCKRARPLVCLDLHSRKHQTTRA